MVSEWSVFSQNQDMVAPGSALRWACQSSVFISKLPLCVLWDRRSASDPDWVLLCVWMKHGPPHACTPHPQHELMLDTDPLNSERGRLDVSSSVWLTVWLTWRWSAWSHSWWRTVSLLSVFIDLVHLIRIIIYLNHLWFTSFSVGRGCLTVWVLIMIVTPVQVIRKGCLSVSDFSNFDSSSSKTIQSLFLVHICVKNSSNPKKAAGWATLLS